MGIPSISVIIPVYNEERTIASIIEIVRSWGKTAEIIVVDDGSTDKTLKAIAQFKHDIMLISDTINHGKGYALARGIEKARGEILLFLDGDIVGLTHKDLDDLSHPVFAHQADMVLGAARMWNKKSLDLLNDVTGLRVMRRENIVSYLPQMEKAGRGVEFLFNDIHREKTVKVVRLPHVFLFGKMDKLPVREAIVDYLKEGREFLVQIMRLQAEDLTPHTKRAVQIVQQYLKMALDSF